MKKTLLLASSVLALFTSVQAQGVINWTSGVSENFPTDNGRILCDASSCTLSGINTPYEITAPAFLTSSGFGSFIFSDTSTIKASSGSAILQLTSSDASAILINGDVENTGLGMGLCISSLNTIGSIDINGYLIAGTTDGGATGVTAVNLNNILIGGNFTVATAGRVESATFGIEARDMKITGDLINLGHIGGGSSSGSGILMSDSEVTGVINNTGDIVGYSGIVFSSDSLGNAYSSENVTIENSGHIEGLSGDAIAFEHNSLGWDIDNTLAYSGSGTLNAGTDANAVQIDMGDGTDILNLSNITAEWFSINGAETINVNNFTILANYVNTLTPLAEHTDITTTSFTFVDTAFLVTTTEEYQNDSELIVMSNASAIEETDLAGLSIQFTGFEDIIGNFYLDGGNLMYYIASGVPDINDETNPITGGIVASLTPITSSVMASLNSSIAVNRSAMNVISQHAKAKTQERVEYAALKSDTGSRLRKESPKSGVWAQGFGEMAEYDGKTTGAIQSTGYDSTTYGLVFGYDRTIGKGLLVGTALSYAMSEVEGTNNNFNTDVTQYQLSLYGSYNYKKYFLDAQVGMGQASYDQSRSYSGSKAKADFDGNSMNAGLGAGYIWSATNKLNVTPYARVNYIQSTQDSYVESISSLRVDEVELESTQASLGSELSYIIASGSVKWLPRLFVEYAHELGDEEIAINSQFTDSLVNGTTGYAPDLGESIIRAGTGISMIGKTNNYNLSFDYKFETRDNYVSHGLVLNGKLFF